MPFICHKTVIIIYLGCALPHITHIAQAHLATCVSLYATSDIAT